MVKQTMVVNKIDEKEAFELENIYKPYLEKMKNTQFKAE